MLSHAGLTLFLATIALLVVGRAVVLLRSHLSPRQREPHVRPGTLELQAAGEGHGLDLAPWMRVVVTLAVLASALFIVLSKHYEADQQKWAFGVVGTVLGYWLKA